MRLIFPLPSALIFHSFYPPIFFGCFCSALIHTPAKKTNLGSDLKESFDGSAEAWNLAKANSPCDALRQELNQLVLSNKAVHEREVRREETGKGVEAPVVLRLPYVVLCGLIDLLFENRPLSRFWFLETVARMPYFSYISMLHLCKKRSAHVKSNHGDDDGASLIHPNFLFFWLS